VGIPQFSSFFSRISFAPGTILRRSSIDPPPTPRNGEVTRRLPPGALVVLLQIRPLKTSHSPTDNLPPIMPENAWPDPSFRVPQLTSYRQSNCQIPRHNFPSRCRLLALPLIQYLADDVPRHPSATLKPAAKSIFTQLLFQSHRRFGFLRRYSLTFSASPEVL